MNANKKLLMMFLYSQICWFSDLVVLGHASVLNLPLGATVVYLFVICGVFLWCKELGKNNLRMGRILLWITLIPFVLANGPSWMDASSNMQWNIQLGIIRYIAFIIAFALAQWSLTEGIKKE